ncbi:proteasome component [Cordyceps fumosorosea ARSEF 2679]|uniref:Proteasome component n=1 Tax=Cordyceps fumosorosea (strain ARSEF 2679) TaxID=1081104 RepID=A0A167NMN9_CORFA|nr:proteasome component [Cordyceps fumosorosea ARSEF 2679]OAA55723.1 proteasome component [Cordyceps fumosorosea ARSEF 2679]
MAEPSPEQKELRLVESVEFKILNVANKEQKLHELLQRFLAPLILKAASDHASVRAKRKVIKTLALLKTFIQPPQVVLPVKALLQQYRTTDSAVIKQLDLPFILHSLDRTDVEDRRHLLPIALKGLAADENQPRAATILNIILRLILDVRIPPRGSKDDEAFRNALGLDDPADAKYLAYLLGVFLRLRAASGSQTLAQSNPTLSSTELALFPPESPDTENLFRRITELRVKVVTLLASAAFTDEEKFLPALYSAGSFDGRVASTGEEIIKRSSVSLEDRQLVERLFSAHALLPAANRTRILGMLSKSAISTTMTDGIMRVVTLDFLPPEEGSPPNALQPSSTLERTKLHKALFQYLSWVAQIGPSKPGFTIGPQLIQKMREYVESQGWPVASSRTTDDINLRSRAYETIGLLARSADMPTDDKLDLAAWLFRTLSEDSTNDAIVNIDGALSSLTANIDPSTTADNSMLRTMLLTYMSLPLEPPVVRSTRHAVVKWANQCLPFSDIHARWIDILAVAGQYGERNDVIEQGHKGLDPWTYFAHSQVNAKMPSWRHMMVAYFDTLIEPAPAPVKESVDGLPILPARPVFQNFHGSRVPAFPVALKYCKNLMFLSALDDFAVQPDWMQALNAQLKNDIMTQNQVRAYLQKVEPKDLVFYLQTCLDGAFAEDSPIVEDCIRCFVEVASLAQAETIGQLTGQTMSLLPLIKSNNREVRTLAAKATGILAAHPVNGADAVSNFCITLHSFFDNAQKKAGPDLNAAEGALMAFGHLQSRCVYYDRELPETTYPLCYLADESTPASLFEAALDAFAQLWSAKLSVPLPTGDHSLEIIIKRLSAQAKKGNERAIAGLGRLASAIDANQTENTSVVTSEWEQGTLGAILKGLFALHELKQVEIHFTVGEAITAAVGRWDSDQIKLGMDVECHGHQFQRKALGSVIAAVLMKLFADCKGTKPSLLKASGIWLFCIVQYCSHVEQVQSRLRETQSAFMRLLNARDELVQETASRGLSLVYERGDADLKSALVKDLVAAFTGSGTQLKVEEDTELFEPGALPTGEGNSVTSYKDIVNLANEVGDQRLVYKFMSLAANAATWSTRSAFGRFGLSNILSESEVDPKLYPKLYRYRFDPNSNVQRSMDDIWKSLIKDSNATIDQHFEAIMEDLLKSILGREWRMREASCAAIAELVHGRPFVQYEKYYRDIWTAALKVLDDVKGSVREAALKLCMGLSNGLVRQLEESNHSVAAKAMMGEALPFLLSEKGIENSVQEVQIFATITVMKICKHGGVSLRPFIPEIVSHMLGLLSTIEPQQINYHYQRAGEESRDQIDKLRSQMVNQSPISEAIENSLRFVDADVMLQLAPRLEATIKTAIGMPTKIGCSRVLTTLFTRHTSDIKPLSSKFLKLLEKQTLDKNDEVSQAYARAAAYIMRAVEDADRQRFCSGLVELYFNGEDESRRQKVSDVVVSLAKISPDHFSSQEADLLPFAYLGSHDTDEYASKVFKEVWSQHAGSSRTVMRYVPEIVALVERCLATTQWALRHTGAFTIAAAISDVASATEMTGGIGEPNCKALWPSFDKALALKTFPGKEKVLSSFPKFVKSSQAFWKGNEQVSAQMKKISIREAKRNNDEYRPHAFHSLWEFAQARSDLDLLSEIADIVTPYLDTLTDEDKMEVDSKEDKGADTARNGFEAIARGYTRSPSRDVAAVAAAVLKTLQPYLAHDKFGAIKREVWYKCVADMMAEATADLKTGATTDADGGAATTLTEYLDSLDLERVETGTHPQRNQRIEAVAAALKAREAGVFGAGAGAAEGKKLREMVERAVQEERAMDLQRAWRKILEELA